MQTAVNEFLTPNRIDVTEYNQSHAKVVLEPLERGFGHTLGNALRRIAGRPAAIISFLEGMWVRRPQTLHCAALGRALAEMHQAGADFPVRRENALSRDELLDNVMLYWLPATGASSARLYWESFNNPPFDPVEIPVSCSIFPKEIFRCSRRWAEKHFPKLVYFNELEKGGHFAAFEQPETYINEVRAGLRHARS